MINSHGSSLTITNLLSPFSNNIPPQFLSKKGSNTQEFTITVNQLCVKGEAIAEPTWRPYRNCAAHIFRFSPRSRCI